VAVPAYQPGEPIPSADANNWWLPQAAVTTATQTQASNIVLTDDTVLFVSVQANATYQVQMHLVFQGGGGGQAVMMNLTGPSGASGSFSSNNSGNDEIPLNSGQTIVFALATIGVGAGNDQIMDVFGTLVVGATAGTLQFQWCQQNSSATSMIREPRSTMVLRRIA
jgi:hypothetical protein